MMFFIYLIFEGFKFVLLFGPYHRNIVDKAQIAAGFVFNDMICLQRLAWWLASCARKPEVPGSSPAARYVQRWALCSNRPANV